MLLHTSSNSPFIVKYFPTYIFAVLLGVADSLRCTIRVKYSWKRGKLVRIRSSSSIPFEEKKRTGRMSNEHRHNKLKHAPYLLLLCEHNRILVNEHDDELQDGRNYKVESTADGQKRTTLRKGHGVELGDEGKDAGDEHQKKFEVVPEVIGIKPCLLNCCHSRIIEHLLHLH